MEIVGLSQDNWMKTVEKAALILESGGLVVYPTETVYGIGADATNEEAVTGLLQYKNRPAGKAVSVMVDSREEAARYVGINEVAENLYRNFLPGPVTVVSKSLGRVDRRLESENGNLGVRISSHPFAMALVKAFGKPITATSANSSGKSRPYSTAQLLDQLSDQQKNRLNLVIDAGILPPKEPSTVVDTTQAVQEVLRSGESFEELTPPAHTFSEEETRAYGRKIMDSLAYQLNEGPVILALEGDLGAGKTQLAKGVAEALGVNEVITSPTFVIVKEYQGTARLVHLDCWRLSEDVSEQIGLEEYLKPGTVLIVEWPRPILSALIGQGFGYRLNLEIVMENERLIRFGRL